MRTNQFSVTDAAVLLADDVTPYRQAHDRLARRLQTLGYVVHTNVTILRRTDQKHLYTRGRYGVCRHCGLYDHAAEHRP